MSAPKVKGSLILAFAGIPQRNPLSPNGRVFRRLAGDVPAFSLNEDGTLEEMTYEEAFTIRFMRWLPEPMQRDFRGIFENFDDMPARMKDFMPKLRAHKAVCPPPWDQETA